MACSFALFSSTSRFLSSSINSSPCLLTSPSRLVPRATQSPQPDPDLTPKPSQPSAPESIKIPDPAPAVKPKKVSTSFFDVFSFSGPAPETINGRLAMLGFAAAMGVEAATGNGLLSQINDGGLQWFVLVGVLISAASLIPMFKGVSTESKSGSIMSAQAETWNGRAAMLGLVALAVTEYVKQGPLIF